VIFSGLCPQRLMSRVRGPEGQLRCSGRGEKEGLICTLMERSMQTDSVGVAQLRFFVISRYWHGYPYVFKLYRTLAIEVSKRAHLKLLSFCWKEKHFQTLFEQADVTGPCTAWHFRNFSLCNTLTFQWKLHIIFKKYACGHYASVSGTFHCPCVPPSPHFQLHRPFS
jgi:hypothetical protein